MIPAVAIVSIAAFIVAFGVLNIVAVASRVLTIAKKALGAMQDKSIDDDAREKIVQKASLQMIVAFLSILLRSAAALLIGFIPILIAGWAGWATQDAVLDYLARVDVIATATLVMVVGYLVWMRLRRSA